MFNSLSFTDAKYTSGVFNRSGDNVKIAGNYIENVPKWIEKCGINFDYKNLSANFQYSFTSKSYNDAFNTAFSANGVTGEIPAYHVLDFGMNWQLAKQYHLSIGINNLTNEEYFNRRITFYPGPGILPADGRTFDVSFGFKI